MTGPAFCAGLPLENRRNDRYSHITKLASAIVKATCSMVILGKEEGILLVNAEGLDEDDDPWLPQFCAWALGQCCGLRAIEDMSADERWELSLLTRVGREGDSRGVWCYRIAMRLDRKSVV